MNKVNKVLIGVIVVLVVVLGVLLAWREWGSGPSYYAVSLRTGDLYFGQLTRFPSFGLKHVYLIQVNQNDTKNPLSIQRFKNAFWGPEDFLRINRDEVVWMARLDPQGELAKLISTNPDLTAPAASAPAPSSEAPKETPAK
jgi:hypothetical protein